MIENNNTRKTNFVYIAIAILTLIISVTGATYAYFYSTRSVINEITGNMATITFNITVNRKTTVENTTGLIPMTNAMVEMAVSDNSGNGICVDDNSNAVCQIYKIGITNSSSASMFFDGYVTLTGGSGTSTDDDSAPTTMRWAQAFCDEDPTTNEIKNCSTAGSAPVHQTNTINISALDTTGTAGHNTAAILKARNNVVTEDGATIQGNPYDVIGKNFIRISKAVSNGYDQEGEITSALVFNQYLSPDDKNDNNNTGTSVGACNFDTGTSKCKTYSSSDKFTDAQVYYIVVWLTETGKDQTAVTGTPNPAAGTDNFFSGIVTFKSAEGNEVTAAFGDYISVKPNQTPTS